MRSAISILALAAVATTMLLGCANKKSSSAGSADASPPLTLSQRIQAIENTGDAPPGVALLFQVDVYQLAVPFGLFSNNEEFWKRVDEQCVDALTYDMLYRNGVRVGQAPLSELDFFQKFMDAPPVMNKLSTTAPEAQRIEIEMKRDLVDQRIARFDTAGALVMRDYDRSTNVFNLSFGPTPRRVGSIRLALCPMVRENRKHLEYTVLNNETEFNFVSAEILYDLNLRVDVPHDRFFIVMPSPEAKTPCSVGAAFLTKQGHTAAMEQVLLIIPRPYIVSDPKVAAAPSPP